MFRILFYGSHIDFDCQLLPKLPPVFSCSGKCNGLILVFQLLWKGTDSTQKSKLKFRYFSQCKCCIGNSAEAYSVSKILWIIIHPIRRNFKVVEIIIIENTIWQMESFLLSSFLSYSEWQGEKRISRRKALINSQLKTMPHDMWPNFCKKCTLIKGAWKVHEK